MNKVPTKARLSVGRPYVTAFRLLASGERNCVSIRVGQTKFVPQLVRTSLPDPKRPHANVDRRGGVSRITVSLFTILILLYRGGVAESECAAAGDLFTSAP